MTDRRAQARIARDADCARTGEFPAERRQYLLDDVVDVGRLSDVGTHPAADERSIEMGQPAARRNSRRRPGPGHAPGDFEEVDEGSPSSRPNDVVSDSSRRRSRLMREAARIYRPGRGMASPCRGHRRPPSDSLSSPTASSPATRPTTCRRRRRRWGVAVTERAEMRQARKPDLRDGPGVLVGQPFEADSDGVRLESLTYAGAGGPVEVSLSRLTPRLPSGSKA